MLRKTQQEGKEVSRAMSSSDEVIFKTAAKAPWGFDSWTFFWEMPKIDPDAVLTYVVIQPDGNEYYSYNRPIKHATGAKIRSDFSEGFAGGDPHVFYGQDIVFRLRVDKGKIYFAPRVKFSFEFRTEVRIGAVRA